MARATVKLNHAAMREIAKALGTRNAVAELAEQVAENVRNQHIKVGDRPGGKHEEDLPVKVVSSITDRARSVVMLAHPAGLAVQAKHGALTKAASAAGLKMGHKK